MGVLGHRCPRTADAARGWRSSRDTVLLRTYSSKCIICCISCLVHSPHSRHLDTHGDPRLTLTHMDTLVLRFSVRAADRSASSACATTWAARETAATRYSSPRRRSLLSMGASRLWPERAGVSEGRSRSRDFGWGGGGEARRGRRFESWRVSAGCQAVRQAWGAHANFSSSSRAPSPRASRQPSRCLCALGGVHLRADGQTTCRQVICGAII